jgi:hypothetical protein
MKRKTNLPAWVLPVVFLVLLPMTGAAQQVKPDQKEAGPKKTTTDESGGLDFTKGDLVNQTIGPIKAEADKPQVTLMQRRINPEFKTYELLERSFVQEILSTATHQQLNKKFKKKTFKIEADNTGNE